MARIKVELKRIRAPRFGLPREQPQVQAEEYVARLAAARTRARKAKLDALLVYGDREHSANLAYLTGYDPRFEEALLLLPTDEDEAPSLLVGNEGWGYAALCPPIFERRMYQGFSLLGQPRDKAPRLASVLQESGLRRSMRVGFVGWKYADRRETDKPESWIEAPSYLVDLARRITGPSGRVTNATTLFMNPDDGLRTVNSADQLAAFEFAAAHCSQAVRNVIENLRVNITELEAVEAMRLNGLPMSCHPMFSTGPRVRAGLCSPGSRIIHRGDPFTTAIGLCGGLTARAGYVAADASELGELGDLYLDTLVKPYFSAAVAWYRTIGIGVTGGRLQQAVDDALDPSGLKLALNPGHLIHLDEWLHSPVTPGSRSTFKSGMLVQADLIPIAETPLFGSNVEDTIALADAPLRREIASRYPDMWARIQSRRRFMRDALGIRLRPEVLPFSNMPAMLAPFALRPDRMMAVV